MVTDRYQHLRHHADVSGLVSFAASAGLVLWSFLSGGVLDRLMPRVRRLERLRFGSLSGRASAKQHAGIVDAAAAGDVQTTAARVRENWLSLGTLIDRSFE